MDLVTFLSFTAISMQVFFINFDCYEKKIDEKKENEATKERHTIQERRVNIVCNN